MTPLQTFKPLAGVSVLSFELAFSLPSGTRALHDLGADVVRVSPPERQQDRYISVIDGVFHGKRCIAIDLTKPSGRDLALRLALKADVVCNNFRPHVLEKYGLGAETLRAARPNLITLQLSGYGTPGPWSNFPAFGPSTEAAGGLNRLMVDDNEIPTRLQTGVFADQLAGRNAALAIVAALKHRQDSGEGASLDLSMAACITHLLGVAMTRAALDDGMPPYRFNRDPRFVPQGIYRTLGSDEWLSLSIVDDAAWVRLCRLVADPALSPDADREQRQAKHDAIDVAIERWTSNQDKDDLCRILQQAGIAAAPVRTVADSATDPQFLARKALQSVHHHTPKLGFTAHPHPPLPWRIVGRERRRLTDYRHTGQDNAAVLKSWLQMSDVEIAALRKCGALASQPTLNLKPRPESPLAEPGFASKLGLPAAGTKQ